MATLSDFAAVILEHIVSSLLSDMQKI